MVSKSEKWVIQKIKHTVFDILFSALPKVEETRPIQNKKTEERLKKVNKEEDGSKDGQRYADVTS